MLLQNNLPVKQHGGSFRCSECSQHVFPLTICGNRCGGCDACSPRSCAAFISILCGHCNTTPTLAQLRQIFIFWRRIWWLQSTSNSNLSINNICQGGRLPFSRALKPCPQLVEVKAPEQVSARSNNYVRQLKIVCTWDVHIIIKPNVKRPVENNQYECNVSHVPQISILVENDLDV